MLCHCRVFVLMRTTALAYIAAALVLLNLECALYRVRTNALGFTVSNLSSVKNSERARKSLNLRWMMPSPRDPSRLHTCTIIIIL